MIRSQNATPGRETLWRARVHSCADDFRNAASCIAVPELNVRAGTDVTPNLERHANQLRTTRRDESVCARPDGHGPLRVRTGSETGNSQIRGLLLQASRISDHQGSASDQTQHLDVSDGLNKAKA